MQKLNWNFIQVFGDKNPVEEVNDADLVSAVRFDQSGDYLATGDRGGRVVLFERANKGQKKSVRDKKADPRPVEYRFYSEFQSHQPEFDYLKSLEIEEKISRIRWLPKTNNSHFLLTTNARTIKLWKVGEKQLKNVLGTNREVRRGGRTSLVIPKLSQTQSLVSATPRRIYSNAHAYHINSISPCSDGETFISADDLRINLWNYDCTEESFNIVDLKPPNMEELTEVITATEYHPKHCSLFAYASSKGEVKLCDLRCNALCDKPVETFNEVDNANAASFFGEIISSLSDFAFSPDGRYILGRDYMTLKIWDSNMNGKPLRTIQIHEHLQHKLCDLYENEYIFDKFECGFSGDGMWAMTGSYHNHFQVYEVNTERDMMSGQFDSSVEVTRSPVRKKPAPKPKTFVSRLGRKDSKRTLFDDMSIDQIDFSKKILHASWHPEENTLAVAGMC